MLDVRRLRVLREVADRGSLVGAAEALDYSPSAVSQQIAALERETRSRLVERRARGVVLTEAGRILVAHAEVILAELRAAETALAEVAGLRGGRLRLASFATAGATVLPQAITTFRGRHPHIELTLEQSAPEQSVDRLAAGELDLALTVDLEARPVAGVEVIHLFDDPMQLAVRRGHPLAAREELRLEDLKEETWVDVPHHSAARRVLTLACAQAGFEPRVAFESDEYTAIQELVGAGVGVALLPDLALRPLHEAVVLRSLGPDGPRRRVQVATRSSDYRSAAASTMIDILREVTPARFRPDATGHLVAS